MLAEQQLTTTTIEALAAEFGIVRTNPFSDLEAFHVLSQGRDDTDGLMAGDEGKLGEELALVDVQICAADAAGLNLDEDVVVSKLGEVDLDDGVVLWLRVSVQEHGDG